MKTREEFRAYLLNENGVVQTTLISQLFSMFLAQLECLCKPDGDFHIAKTKLREACFFIKRSVASQPENQQEESK